MNKTLSIKEAADIIGIDTSTLVRMTVTKKVPCIKGEKGKPFRYELEAIKEYTEKTKEPELKTEKEPSKKERMEKGPPEGDSEGLLTAQEAAEYLGGLSLSAIQAATRRGRIEPAVKRATRNGGFLYSRQSLDKYKESSDGYRKELSDTRKVAATLYSKENETARKLLSYAKEKGYENPWEAIKELLEQAEK